MFFLKDSMQVWRLFFLHLLTANTRRAQQTFKTPRTLHARPKHLADTIRHPCREPLPKVRQDQLHRVLVLPLRVRLEEEPVAPLGAAQRVLAVPALDASVGNELPEVLPAPLYRVGVDLCEAPPPCGDVVAI